MIFNSARSLLFNFEKKLLFVILMVSMTTPTGGRFCGAYLMKLWKLQRVLITLCSY